MGNLVKLVDFNPEDGIRAKTDECGLCLERLTRGDVDKAGNLGIPVITHSMGLTRICAACWVTGYVSIDVDKLHATVIEHEMVEVVEIHPSGEYTAYGKVVTNLDDYAQAWAICADGCMVDVTDETRE